MLEKRVMNADAADKDRIAAGFFLVCIYGRLRYSDAQHINSVKLDTQKVQGKTLVFLEATCDDKSRVEDAIASSRSAH